MKVLLLTACFAVSGVLCAHNSVRFRLYDGNTNKPFIQANLSDVPSLIFGSPKYDVNKLTVLVIHGFLSNAESDAVVNVSDAFLARGGFNVIGVDWRDLAYFTTFPPANLIFYPQAADNTVLVGTSIAQLLDTVIAEKKLLLKNLVLVGHSLGAQICGSIGRGLQKKPPVIIGLDPAGPLFQSYSTLKGLSSADADIVHFIHTDASNLGTDETLGHANFRVNIGKRSQPGCSVLFGLEVSCSHGRAYEYFADAIKNPTGYPAIRCANAYKFLSRYSCSSDVVYMGYPPDSRAKGVYYLETNGPPSFSRALQGVVNFYKYITTDILK